MSEQSNENQNKEIERKFLIDHLPADIDSCSFHELEQGYLCTSPVVRVRREDDLYYMTYKGDGLMERTEYNLPLTKEGYEHLLKKADGNIIKKRRYLIPLEGSEYTVELDVFAPPFAPLLLAEVEFPSAKEALFFVPPVWFGKEVTNDPRYHNSNMSRQFLP